MSEPAAIVEESAVPETSPVVEMEEVIPEPIKEEPAVENVVEVVEESTPTFITEVEEEIEEVKSAPVETSALETSVKIESFLANIDPVIAIAAVIVAIIIGLYLKTC